MNCLLVKRFKAEAEVVLLMIQHSLTIRLYRSLAEDVCGTPRMKTQGDIVCAVCTVLFTEGD